jgi:hypothetical protein
MRMKNYSKIFSERVCCPCCGYPTLDSNADYEICELCNWEDDGQTDDDADEVRGGPNADYSLTEARCNFLQYRVMYHPDREMRITGGDSPLEWETKGKLMDTFKLLESNAGDQEVLQNKILRLEEVLRNETARQVKEYEKLHSNKE